MNKKDLNQMENTTSAQVYYQWLEKSISASKGCYEMTVIEGELSGMKILWEGEMPVCVYMTDEKTETKKKAAAIITSVMEQTGGCRQCLSLILVKYLQKKSAADNR